jgi:hypothetical protein
MRTLQSIRLTDTQKRVMCKIVAAPTPKVAGDQLSADKNLVAARDILNDLNLITMTPRGEVALSDQGTQIMQQEALIDDAGELTDDGQQFAMTNAAGKSTEDRPTTPPQTSPMDTGMPPPGGAMPGAMPGMESKEYGNKFNLLKEFIERNNVI